MNNPRMVYRFANDIYSDNVNMLAIYEAQSEELQEYETDVQRIFFNNLVKYCDNDGLKRLEDIFNIKADETTESREFRETRLIIKFTMRLPYTVNFMKNMLESLFGADKYEFEVNYGNRHAYVGIETDIEKLITSTLEDIRQILPANMTMSFIQYIPYVHGYLRKYYTHEQMKQFTHGELNNG